LKPEIKKRIEQIKKGVVPEGYKKTRVGIVPSEWDVSKIGNFIKETSQKNKLNSIQHVVSVTKYKGIVDSLDYFKNHQVFSQNLSGYKVIRKGQYAFPPIHLNEGAIGRLNHADEAVLSPMYTVFKLNESQYNSDIFIGIIKSKKYLEMYKTMVQGTVNRRGAISLKDFSTIPIVSPPLPEQEKIAEILSTWDKAIELKEQLIAGKKQQKKWLMQNLLTGKKRLPGFSGEWQEVRLGDVCTINDNVLSENTQSNFEFWYIDLSSVDKGKIAHPTLAVKFEELPSRARRLFKKDDILMSTVRPYLLGFAYIDKEYDHYVCSTGFAVIRAKEAVCSKFVYHTLFSGGVIRQMNQRLMGTNYPALNNDDVYQLYFELPPLPEQTAIAEILSTADREIDLHEKHLEELKKQKKALMQLLLTGIVRVNAQEVS